MALKWNTRKANNWTDRVERVVDLAALEPGDRLATISRGTYYGDDVIMWEVVRFTDTRVVLKSLSAAPGRSYEVQYRLEDGLKIGKSTDGWRSWSSDLKDPADRVVITTLQRKRMRSFRQELEKLAGQRTENLEQMDDVLRQIRELEEEVRSDLARMESSVKESADAN